MLSKRLQDCVMFARFAEQNDIDPVQLGELLQLAHRASAAGVRECNQKGYKAGPARERFEAAARELGYGTEWNGLGPSLMLENRTIYLPDVG